jgi:hypothetical protein
MGHTLFTQVLAAQLPKQFWGSAVVEQLMVLDDAGYIKVTLSPPHGAAPPCATVNEVTHLGRAVARYCGSDNGPGRRRAIGERLQPLHHAQSGRSQTAASKATAELRWIAPCIE